MFEAVDSNFVEDGALEQFGDRPAVVRVKLKQATKDLDQFGIELLEAGLEVNGPLLFAELVQVAKDICLGYEAFVILVQAPDFLEDLHQLVRTANYLFTSVRGLPHLLARREREATCSVKQQIPIGLIDSEHHELC